MSQFDIGNEEFGGAIVANKGSAGDVKLDVFRMIRPMACGDVPKALKLLKPRKLIWVAVLQSSSKPDFGIFDNIMLMLNEFWDRQRDSGNGGSAGEFIGVQKSMNELMLWLDENQDLYRDIFNGMYDGGSAGGSIALGECVNEFMLWLDQQQNLFRKWFRGIEYEGTSLNYFRMALLSEIKRRLNRIGVLSDTCNSIHHVGFTSRGINNGGYTGCTIANGFAGAGWSGGPPGGFQYPMDVVGIAGDSGSGGPAGGFQYPIAFEGIPLDIGNGALAGCDLVYETSAGGGIVNEGYTGGGLANGSAGVGGLGGSPGEYGSGGGGPPLGGGGESPSGGGGPGGPPGEVVGGGGGSYERVRSTVIVDESEIVCIVKVRGRANRRIVRTSVKARPGKIRHTVRFKRVNSPQGQAEM